MSPSRTNRSPYSFWLTSAQPLPDTVLAAAQTKGHERYEGYVEALGHRLARSRELCHEIVRDVAESVPQRNEDQNT